MKYFKQLIFILTILATSNVLWSQTAPKHEMRASWFTTVWGLDWPANTIPSTGDSYYIQKQKDQLIHLLDRLQAANMNAAFFQVRSECDAMYQSEYEPWSAYLVATRGMDPGYDPLAFAVEECHKRGMELHAWLNPYRFESSQGKYAGQAGDYRQTNPNWVLEYPDKSDGSKNVALLDPGNPEVRKRIADIVKDILSKYDVDGIVFDDYFYAYGGTPSNLDAYSQNLYKPEGINLGDWRRDNINRMVEDVHKVIQENKPWVTFGLSPFGIWTTDRNVAAKEGLTLPDGIVGSNMYEQIYCDPVAWLKEKTVDYVSPQLYWPTTSSGQDYDILGPWWSDVCNHFGRHLYVSHSLSALTPSTYAVSLKSGSEKDLAVELNGLSMLEYHASNQNANLKSINTNPSEYGKQININRNSDKNGAPGSVFFRTANFFTAGFVDYLTNNQFKNQALPPALSWQTAQNRSIPANLKIENDSLLWDSSEENVRFVVYAIPNDLAENTGNTATSEYLIGISYSKSFALGKYADLISTHQFAVAVYDRFGNEFPAAFINSEITANNPATLLAPAKNAEVYKPFLFNWEVVETAESYILQVAGDELFSNKIDSRNIADNKFDGSNISMETGETYYWRVITRSLNANDTVSEIRAFTLVGEPSTEILQPANNATEISQTPVIEWENFGEGYKYQLQIAYNNAFSSAVIDTTGIEGTNFAVTKNTLTASGTFYIRVRATKDELFSAWSSNVKFSTVTQAPEVPVILSPENDATIDGQNLVVQIREEPKASGFRMELSGAPTFPWTDRKVVSLDAFEYRGMYNDLADGTYYVRVRANYSNTNTDWSATTTVKVLTTGIDDLDANGLALFCPSPISSANTKVEFELPRNGKAVLTIFSSTGNKVFELADRNFAEGKHKVILPASGLKNGIYILVLQTQYGRKTLKIVK